MNRTLLLLPLLAACGPVQPTTPVTTAEPPLVIPQGAPPESVGPHFDRAGVETNLLASARQRFGEALVQRAIAAPAFLFTKHYRGMAPPPPPDAGPDWKYPEPPVAMLFMEHGVWMAADAGGVRQARPDKVSEIDAILSNPAFGAEPDFPAPGCTDSGASLLMVKLPARPRQTRRGVCGAGQHGEHLVFRALEA